MSFDSLFHFEDELAEYTGAPYVVLTDGCTHAIELVMRYFKVQQTKFTAYTYISIPQTMHNLGIKYTLIDEDWHGEYQFYDTNIWDSARRFEPNMYRPGQIQCLSFGYNKPLSIGRCGAILLDDQSAYWHLSRMRSDGRDLAIASWADQQMFLPGWHYCPALEVVAAGREALKNIIPQKQKFNYPDCRKISIIN